MVPALRFSTDDIAPPDRFAVWREVFGRAIFSVEVEPMAPGPFHAEATIRTLAGLRLLTASSSAVIYRRPASLLQSDDVLFSFGATEGSYAQQRGRESSAQSGDALLMLGAEKAIVARPKEGMTHSLRLPRTLMAASVTDLEDSVCRRIPGSTPALQLLTRYIDVFEDDDILASPELQQSAVTHILDLVVLTLGARHDAAAIAQGRGLRAARLKAIKDDIARNLKDESLTVGAVAARHKLTPRYVQRLFEESGVTFTEYLVAQRLERARQLMSDPRRAEQTLTAIAFAVGFGDLSYFNRTFRRRFGATPSDIRAAARLRH
jgi:AraC-like DNA-binding protein